MKQEEHIHYRQIEKAIGYIVKNFKQQPKLETIAAAMHISPAHFQRLFTTWAGTSPKKFLQYISVEHAKTLLREEKISLFDATAETGLSSTSRLHDLFINIEGMTPAEYKKGGLNLMINYSFSKSLFGDIIIASTAKGICHLAFFEDKNTAVTSLKTLFPNALFKEKTTTMQKNALTLFSKQPVNLPEIKLHLKGTDFQLKVWKSLLNIPQGELSTYKKIAKNIGNQKAARAVGTAIGKNPIAYLIPCHRVIKTSGKFDGYRWGTIRKTAIIGWEQTQKEHKK
ncbi:AraC family transcriptional regulator of adaptative response/methylated-DNA-[protein]-cysteine methyltransferase [Mesonia hippocampi]|uniref:methylated-DNA--[protein]-cysteine S-methyltransferase n=1 Tax=Mesonia hippocampi TaxID=1628250 RepID=A0A840ERR2_9FLAO|nr:methylated-DNA--[protein]-cysteine S-methyltransferase [Mesonia hippocampi]MBB4119660.1 AraC family transcriptional regulator of adaptative response/methylated-DNA-[protein]-cysteine methyltransferase [Mesonia hippocampi]